VGERSRFHPRTPYSARAYVGLGELDYPLHEHTITVSRCGRICFARKKVNFSTVFAGQKVGIKEEDEGIWQVSFMNYEVGYFDLESCRVDNPFGAKVLTMSPVYDVNHVSGIHPKSVAPQPGLEPGTCGLTVRRSTS
jgi:hypothetical protein